MVFILYLSIHYLNNADRQYGKCFFTKSLYF